MSAESTPFRSPRSSAENAAENAAWQELEAVIDRLSQAAGRIASTETFYEQLIIDCVQALAARGGTVWLREADGRMRPIAQAGSAAPSDHESRLSHEAILAKAAETAGTSSTLLELEGQKPSMLIVGAVSLESQGNVGADRQVCAIIEINQRPGGKPSAYRGQEQFLDAVCAIAGEFHTGAELKRLKANDKQHHKLFAFSRHIHQAVGVRQTAYRIANEGTAVVGCDRLSVAVRRGRKCQLIASSGVKRLERRTTNARQLEDLAKICLRLNEPIYYADGVTDNLPQITERLEQYVDQSHARQVAIIPIQNPSAAEESSEVVQQSRNRPDRPLAVLIAEQFDSQGADLARDRVTEVSTLCEAALEQAVRWDGLPLRKLLEPLGRATQVLLPQHLVKTASALAALVAMVCALIFVDGDFTIEANGHLQPSVRRNVFASRGGLVEEVFVEHGQTVESGTELLRLRDPELELEWQRVTGQMQTTTEQLDAVRATKSGRTGGTSSALDGYRLSAEQQQLEQQLDNQRRELELLQTERESLVIRSPLAGQVITWDVAGLLIARPVERGQVLLTVADMQSDWHLELDVRDDRMGYLIAAQDAHSTNTPANVPVEYRLASDDRQQHEGHITKIANLAEPAEQQADGRPTVRVEVSLTEPPGLNCTTDELRPGMAATARILCGRRSLGFIWLHDLWNAFIRWTTF